MKKGILWALAPILVFLVLYIGIGVYMGDFYVMPAAVGFLIALLVAFFQNPDRTLAEKLSTLARGAGDENIMIMCLISCLQAHFPALSRLPAARMLRLLSASQCSPAGLS